MRRYTTEKVDKLIQDKREEMGVLKLVEQYKELSLLWDEIPDATLHKLKVERQITHEKAVQIICPSSVALTYVRQRRDKIESTLREFMIKHQLESLEIIIK